MSSRDEILDGAARQLRAASNPSADERSRVLAALLSSHGAPPAQHSGASPAPSVPERAQPSPMGKLGVDRLGIDRLGAGWSSRLGRRHLVWGLSLGLALFGIGVGVGVGVGFGLGRDSIVVPPPGLGVTPVQPSPAATPLVDAVVEPVIAAVVENAAPAPAVRQQPKRSKPRARGPAALARPAPSPLRLAEALQLLHRAERAIYSDNAAWALSLLDQLDERAPRNLLHEERVATRILALCASGQVEPAERLARQAREEAPTSIYGDILERACDGTRLPTPHSALP